MPLTYVSAPITKFVKDPATGHLTVYGKLTGPDLDLDQQIMDPKWLEKAVPAWFQSGANIRVMHRNQEAGKGTDLEQMGDDWYLKSLIVDKDACEKVESEVLSWYSIGIKGPRLIKDAAAPGGRVCGGTIVESSIVDRGCNPTTKFVLAKMAGDALESIEEWDTPPEDPAVAAAKGVLADLAALVPDLTKADDESSDIAGAMAAISSIARLIQSEADGLAAGQMGEAADIRLLLDAVSALRWFMEREAAEPEPSEEDDMTDSLISLGVNADLVKAAQADSATDDDRAALRSDVVKALGLESLADSIATTVTNAVTTKIDADIEATKAAAADTIKGVADRLAEVERMAAPGGPVRARTTEQTNKAAQADQKRAQAAHYRRIAGEVDHVTAEGYLAKAALLDAEIAATA